MKKPSPIIRIRNEGQRRQVIKLIQNLCANYFDETCVLLDDDYESQPCPQMLTYSLCCRYFLSAVLPANAELFADLMKADDRKRCAACGQTFVSRGKNARYCEHCAYIRKRRSNRLGMRKKRTSMWEK